MNFASALTITFSTVAENHVGNQQIGELMHGGYSEKDLLKCKAYFEQKGCRCEMIALHELLEADLQANKDLHAWVLVIRNGVKAMGVDDSDVYDEIMVLEHDKCYYDTRRGKVLNKRARHNLCFSDVGQMPDYENGKGRIVCWDDVTGTKKVRNKLHKALGAKARDLNGELNVYYDPKKCGIGFHGDTERDNVIGMRIGVGIPLVYQWYHKSLPVGEPVIIKFASGDMYVMSTKAVGTDWKKRSQYTLRHAAGCKTYTKVEED